MNNFNFKEFFEKNKAVLVTSALMVLLIGAFVVWKFYPGLLSNKEHSFRIDEDLLLKEQASTKKSTATTNDPIHAKVNCDKDKNLNLSLKNEKEVIDQKNVQCKKEDSQVTFDNQIKAGENYQIDVEDSTFTEGQNNAQSNGDQQAAQDQAADLVGNQNTEDHQQENQQQTGNQSPTGDQQVVSDEQPANQEKPGSDSPNQDDTSKTVAATGDENPNLVTFGWGFDTGSQTPPKPDKQDKPTKPENPRTEEESSSDETVDESVSDEPAPDESTSDSSDHSNHSLLGGIKEILTPKPKPQPKPETKPQTKPETKSSVDVTVDQNQQQPPQQKKTEDQLEVHISAFQSQRQNSSSSANNSSQIDIHQQQSTTNGNNQQSNSNHNQTQQPPAQENGSESKPQSKTKSSDKVILNFPGTDKFTKDATGPEIESLITLLNQSGYQTKEKHKFTTEVSTEVKKFQQDQGWKGKDANGIPGPKTWKQLVNNYKGDFPGAHYFTKETQNNGYFVKKLEKKLKEKGLISKVTGSGKYTDTMKNAVQKFQKSQGWTGKEADGIPGKETWKRLMK